MKESNRLQTRHMMFFSIIYYSTTPRIIAQQCEIMDVENMLNKNKP